MDIEYTITIEETDDKNTQPIEEKPIWNWIRVLFVVSIMASAICVIVSVATDYGDVSTKLAFASILSTIILFEVLVCHTFNMADKERDALKHKRKSSYPYLGM